MQTIPRITEFHSWASIVVTCRPHSCKRETPAAMAGVGERGISLGGCKPSGSGFKMNTHFASDQSFFQGHRSMARMCLLAVFFLGLCNLRPALADEPASIPRVTTEQIHQAVDRAIGYVQTESAAWL